ncbi:RNA-directed DNA polymerase, eukaryota, partial [Tanacetum coccineum]
LDVDDAILQHLEHWKIGVVLSIQNLGYSSRRDKLKMYPARHTSASGSSFRRSPRSSIEEAKLLLLISNTSSVILPNISDRWSWLLDPSGDFSVKSTREFIDDSMLPKTDVPTRWVKSIPIKINIFAWRVSLDKLPTRLNLSLRGLDIPSIICPLCSIVVESTSHLLFSCQLARQLMIKVVHWWELEYQDFHSYEDWLLWFKNLRVSKRLKDVFEGVCYISWWVIWKFRNQVLFGINFPRLDLLFDDIVRLSFHWCSSRFVVAQILIGTLG